ncbi:cation diffusion facilitator family transporter [Alloscardovia criceti]|uniref:cation diffusion facilitator family transporter n=1 Tax=Alloscardovia criceti TaxID=356828 RepID=UPI00037EECCB|nr:cation diffusion facilitator family transporter [Alloscardovia criceti]
MAESHDHNHSHAAASRGRLALALSVTAVILCAELIGAYVTRSLSLAADAGHMAVDSSSLVIALIAAHLMTKPRDERRSWGWARSEVIAAALQAGMLIVISFIVLWEAIHRFFKPETIDAVPTIIVGIIGLVANVLSLLILSAGRGASLNMRAAFLEVLNDALGSVAVIVSAIIVLIWGWSNADAVASLFIAVLMIPRAWTLLRRSMSILMENTPPELDVQEIKTHIYRVQGVQEIHDLHISTISTGLVAMSVHIVVDPELSGIQRDEIVHAVQACVAQHFEIPISHATIQVDSPLHFAHEELDHQA